MAGLRHCSNPSAKRTAGRGFAMAVFLVLACWVGTVLYFFGLKILVLYDVLISLFTHVMPLGPLAVIVLVVVGIVYSCPNREAE
jgi:hypothetical protein